MDATTFAILTATNVVSFCGGMAFLAYTSLGKQPVVAPEQPSDNGCIDATLHSEVIDILTVALRTPALAHRRQQIEHVLSESGFDTSCKGRCKPKLNRSTYKNFAKKNYDAV